MEIGAQQRYWEDGEMRGVFMEWWLFLLIMFGAFFFLLAIKMPVSFAFLLVNLVAAGFLWRGIAGGLLLVNSIREAVSSFPMLTLPLFILLGEVISQSGLTPNMLESFDRWLGRLPGRLALLSVAAGTVFGALIGSSMATTAMLGTTLVPQMEKRGYKKPMSLGTIMGSANLAVMIPPSAPAIIIAALTDISIGKFLIAIISPGLMLAILYAAYIIIRCWLNPSIAPAYGVVSVTLSQKIAYSAKYLLPFGLVIFLVTGLIFVGLATPTEAAASGALGAIILVAFYRRLSWSMMKRCLANTVRITSMVLLILGTAAVFSQILAYSEATTGFIEFVMALPLSPIMVIIAMQIVGLILGCFMSTVAIMMITLPVFMPIVRSLGYNPFLFSALYLLNMEMGTISPPFGTTLFVMKGVTDMVSPDTTMGDIYLSTYPFLGINLIVMAVMLAFPVTVSILPDLMR